MDLITEKGTFTHGIIFNGIILREFTLKEEVMRHTFLVSNDRTLDIARLSGDDKATPPIAPDEAYFQACIMAARLKVEGIAKVSPEQVENLSKADGMQLMFKSAAIEQRRDLFRTEIAAAAPGHTGTEEAGLPDGGSTGNEPGSGS